MVLMELLLIGKQVNFAIIQVSQKKDLGKTCLQTGMCCILETEVCPNLACKIAIGKELHEDLLEVTRVELALLHIEERVLSLATGIFIW